MKIDYHYFQILSTSSTHFKLFATMLRYINDIKHSYSDVCGRLKLASQEATEKGNVSSNMHRSGCVINCMFTIRLEIKHWAVYCCRC